MHIPMTLRGIMSGFTVRKPTWDEVIDDDKAIKVHMTSDARWNPHDEEYGRKEQALRDAIERDLILPEPRDIGLIQARG